MEEKMEKQWTPHFKSRKYFYRNWTTFRKKRAFIRKRWVTLACTNNHFRPIPALFHACLWLGTHANAHFQSICSQDGIYVSKTARLQTGRSAISQFPSKSIDTLLVGSMQRANNLTPKSPCCSQPLTPFHKRKTVDYISRHGQSETALKIETTVQPKSCMDHSTATELTVADSYSFSSFPDHVPNRPLRTDLRPKTLKKNFMEI